jgi:hypothetical protein
MRKIKKGYNLKILTAIISALFLFNSASYCFADTLRVPVGGPDIIERILKAMNSKPILFKDIVQNVFMEKGYIVDVNSLGMGWRCVVFKAREIKTGKIVAIKIANPYGDPFVPRLCESYCWAMEEAVRFWRQHGIFNHNFSALVQLYDAGVIPKAEMKKHVTSDNNKDLFGRLDWDYHYQVLEFVDGQSLDRLLPRGFFASKDIIDKLVKFIYGIADLYEAGLSHGELVSKNIMIDKNMEFKACDLDPMNQTGFSNDRGRLYVIVRDILRQAYGARFEDFFKQWTHEYVMEHGLRSFCDALIEENNSFISIDKETRDSI